MPRITFENYGIQDSSSAKFEEIAAIMKDYGAPISPTTPIVYVTNDSEILYFSKSSK